MLYSHDIRLGRVPILVTSKSLDYTKLNRVERKLAHFFKCYHFNESCFFTTDSPDKFLSHFMTHHTPHPPVACVMCDQDGDQEGMGVLYSDINSWIDHVLIEHFHRRLFQCNLCIFRAATAIHIKLHQIGVHEEQYLQTTSYDIKPYIEGSDEFNNMSRTCKVIECRRITSSVASHEIVDISSHLPDVSQLPNSLLCCLYCDFNVTTVRAKMIWHLVEKHSHLPICFWHKHMESPVFAQVKIDKNKVGHVKYDGEDKVDVIPGLGGRIDYSKSVKLSDDEKNEDVNPSPASSFGNHDNEDPFEGDFETSMPSSSTYIESEPLPQVEGLQYFRIDGEDYNLSNSHYTKHPSEFSHDEGHRKQFKSHGDVCDRSNISSSVTRPQNVSKTSNSSGIRAHQNIPKSPSSRQPTKPMKPGTPGKKRAKYARTNLDSDVDSDNDDPLRDKSFKKKLPSKSVGSYLDLLEDEEKGRGYTFRKKTRGVIVEKAGIFEPKAIGSNSNKYLFDKTAKCLLCVGTSNAIFQAAKIKQHLMNEHQVESSFKCGRCDFLGTTESITEHTEQNHTGQPPEVHKFIVERDMDQPIVIKGGEKKMMHVEVNKERRKSILIEPVVPQSGGAKTVRQRRKSGGLKSDMNLMDQLKAKQYCGPTKGEKTKKAKENAVAKKSCTPRIDIKNKYGKQAKSPKHQYQQSPESETDPSDIEIELTHRHDADDWGNRSSSDESYHADNDDHLRPSTSKGNKGNKNNRQTRVERDVSQARPGSLQQPDHHEPIKVQFEMIKTEPQDEPQDEPVCEHHGYQDDLIELD